MPQVRAALQINVLFLIGVMLAPFLAWALTTTRWGLILRTAGENADAARAMGYSVNAIRIERPCWAVSGRHRRLVPVPLLSRQLERGDLQRSGIMAVALVIFARWNPMLCLWASLLFGGAGCPWAGAPVGWREPGLLSVQRHALYPDAGHHDHHLLAEAAPSIGAPAELSHHASRPRRLVDDLNDLRQVQSLSLALQR